MTSITLPLKKIPGQRTHYPTFFGGRSFVAPATFLLTIPFTLYTFYTFSHESAFLRNMSGLSPYLWGTLLMACWIKKSRETLEKLIEANLQEAERIFTKNKNYFKKGIFLTILFSFILLSLFSYSLLFTDKLSLFKVFLISIISINTALASFFIDSNIIHIYTHLSFVLSVEFIALLLILRGLWAFNLILLICSYLTLFLFLDQVNCYKLRSFFEKVVY